LIEEVFNRVVSLVNDFKAYFIRHGQEVYENPSPGNRDGGIMRDICFNNACNAFKIPGVRNLSFRQGCAAGRNFSDGGGFI
jgi:hypothetical protein